MDKLIVACKWEVAGVADQNTINAVMDPWRFAVKTEHIDKENPFSDLLFSIEIETLDGACRIAELFRLTDATHLALVGTVETPFGRVECVLEKNQPRAAIEPDQALLSDKARLDWLATRPLFFKTFAPKAYAELRNICARNDDPVYRRALNDSLDAARAEDPVTPSPPLDGVVHNEFPKIGSES